MDKISIVAITKQVDRGFNWGCLSDGVYLFFSLNGKLARFPIHRDLSLTRYDLSRILDIINKS